MTLETWRALAILGWCLATIELVLGILRERLSNETIAIWKTAFESANKTVKMLDDENNMLVNKHNAVIKQYNELGNNVNIILDAIEDGSNLKIGIGNTNPSNKKRVLN
jgi:hypothetical protein